MKQFGKMQNKVIMVVIVSIVAMVGTAIIGSGSASHKPAINLRVEAVKNYPVDPTSQMQRVDATLSLVNNSASVVQISPGLQMQLIDNSGQSHPVTAMYLPAGEVIGGPLAPGAHWIQSIDFDLAPGQNPAKFIFQADEQSDPIEVSL